ncbi:MAG TPA: hypothetical protein VFU69_18085, partial [Ktedonobacterales bacterium]|nr:hypothetical protein [Ktedonobacterales bacterium]
GLTYTHHGRWQVTLRFAPPVFLCDYTDHQRLAQHIEACVHTLSSPAPSAAPTFAEEAAQL